MTTSTFTGRTETGEQILVTIWDDACGEYATRPDPFATWGAPVQLVAETRQP